MCSLPCASMPRSRRQCGRGGRGTSRAWSALTSRTRGRRSRMHSDNAIADQLVDLGVATLHEALGRRNLPAGLTLLVGEPFAGQAVTVGLPAGDNLGVHLALDV